MKKILIVDDDQDVRNLVEKTLRRADREIYTADNGEDGVTQAKTIKPDLIMMDVMMPGAIDGMEATKRIKENPQTKDCIVIMLTAKDGDLDRQKGAEVGADDYFAKPFSPLELMRKADEVLE